MGFFGSLFCCFPGSGSRSKKSRRGNDQASSSFSHFVHHFVGLPLHQQSNSEENSLLENTHGSSSYPRNQDNGDASSITSFGNADGRGGKTYGATGQGDARQREEDEREREERERERLNAIAGQAGNRMISLNRPSSPLTSHTHSPQSSRPASPTLQPQDATSQHSTDPSTHAVPLNPVKQVNLGLARTTSAASGGRGKRGSGVSGRKSTSLRRKEVRSQDGDVAGKSVAVKVDSPKKSVALEPEVVKAVEAAPEPTVKEDPIVVEGSTSAPEEIMETTLSTPLQAPSPKTAETPIADVEEITKQSVLEPAEAKSTVSEHVAEEQPESAQPLPIETPASPVTQPSAASIPTQPEPEKPVISYAAAAAASESSSSADQPSQTHEPTPAPEAEPSKLGLDLHGQSTTTEPELSAEEALVQSVEQQHVPSFAEVVAPVEESEQPSQEATPDDSTPTTPAPEAEAEADAPGAQTPSTEPADNEQALTAADANAAKAGKPKGKGKGGKGKKKKGKK